MPRLLRTQLWLRRPEEDFPVAGGSHRQPRAVHRRSRYRPHDAHRRRPPARARDGAGGSVLLLSRGARWLLVGRYWLWGNSSISAHRHPEPGEGSTGKDVHPPTAWILRCAQDDGEEERISLTLDVQR